MLVSPTSTGIMASVPNITLNGISSVGTLVVVLYAYRMFGSSYGHTPFALSSQVLIVLRVSWRRIVVLGSQILVNFLKLGVVKLFPVV